jgi:hypothetical protein
VGRNKRKKRKETNNLAAKRMTHRKELFSEGPDKG